MSAEVRPIHVPGAAALDSVRQRAHTTLVAWARQWVSGWRDQDERLHGLGICNLGDGMQQPSVHEYEATCCEHGCVWFRCTAADRATFGRAVAGPGLVPRSTCADEWVAEGVERAWEARNLALCMELLGAAASGPRQAGGPPDSLFVFGSGALRLSCEALGLDALVGRAIWRAVPPIVRPPSRLPRVSAVDHATRRLTVRYEALLGSVELELPKVLDLRQDDVLLLPQLLTRPFALVCEGRPLAQVVLGERQGHTCVRLVASPQ